MSRPRSLALLAALVLAACSATGGAPARDGSKSRAVGASAAGVPEARPAPDWRGGAMVAAANPLAVEAGLRSLRAGGSAIDAAIAVQAVLGLVEPQSSGLGGGAFLMYYDAASGDVLAYDGREIAPRGATPTLFLGADGAPLKFFEAVQSGRSIGVPGAVAMLALAHREQGRRPWGEAFAPAIELAERGFAVSPRLNAMVAMGRAATRPTSHAT